MRPLAGLLVLMLPMLPAAHYNQPRYPQQHSYESIEDEVPTEQDPPFRVDAEDAYLTVYGYEVEIHEVQTADGYLLDLYRVSGRRAASGQPAQRPTRNAPIFLMHSLLSSCADWVLMGPGRALAYLLADAGYDVWMGNARGTRYSRKHLHLDPDRSADFWNFSWHEIGLYDVPALIDHVLSVTGHARLHYGGFSQGTMVLFVLLSERPEYNAKLIDMQAISPSVYMYRLEGRIVRTFVSLADPLVAALAAAGRNEILPNRRFIAPLVKIVCADANVTVCRELLYDVAGRNPPQVDDKLLRVFLGHFPAGASLRQLHHFSQIIRSARFARYSPLRAARNANLWSPAPLYNLTQATVPVVVYYGLNDHVVNYRDALQLADEVPNLAAVHQIADRRFTHSDFILAKNSARLLNTILLQELDRGRTCQSPHDNRGSRTFDCGPRIPITMRLALLLSIGSLVLGAAAPRRTEAVAIAGKRSSDGNDIGSYFAIDVEDGALRTPELIAKYGYPVEQHESTGADGYVIALTRIPPRRAPAVHRLPILLVHGLLASSADFLIIGPNNSLAYLLADRGYDVWLADMRGNRYSRRHKRLDSSEPAYWDFTWHEMGYYDLPAAIDYILRRTGARQLNYIGHSQGTTVFFVMAASRPEYNERIAHMYALSPAVCLRRVRSPPVRWLLQHVSALKDLFDTFGVQQFLPHTNLQYEMTRLLCPMSDPNNICMQVVSMTVGPNPRMTDMMAMQILTGHDPAGASVKQLLHFAQLQRTGQFRQFDYGRRNNTERYSHWKPPAYNVSAITAPITIFYARNDWLVDPRDAERFAKQLPLPPTMHLVEDEHFNHLDFTMAKNARSMVYERILADLAERERAGESRSPNRAYLQRPAESAEMAVVRGGKAMRSGQSVCRILLVCATFVPLATGTRASFGGYESVFAIDEEDGVLETPELIRKYGYPVERHEVTTTDGYVLALTRIPPVRRPDAPSLPVLLAHGLFASSADFLIIGPNNSLAYLLADRGRDVWLVDLRGNRYSQRHTHLPSNAEAYWDFSWHEMGYYDLPAAIDRVLLVTGARRLHYIGYSQGTTVFFVMASTRPDYNAKIARMYALSPAVYVQHVRSPIFRWLAENSRTVKRFLDGLGLWQVLPHNRAQYTLQRTLCPPQSTRSVCVKIVEQLVGPNPNGTDPLAQHVVAGHNPSGASSKQLLHFAQLNRYGRFQQFAYERVEQNLARYGAEQPPAYNLSAVTVPIVIFYGLNDWMIDPVNVVRVAGELPNLVSLTAVEDRNFNHLDFIVAKRVRALVYDKLLDDLARLNLAMMYYQVELIRKYGYRARAYTVTTSDGYQLGVHRMSRKEGPNAQLLPVLIIHGLLGSSADWVLIGPEHALGYQLANAGYDVWLGNTRGNRYSRQHERMLPSEVAFWNFSWHEKGVYDLPAMIDHMLNATGHSQIYYIGYSEGSTAFYVMTTTVPEHNAKIRLAHTLAPAVLLDDMRTPVLMSLSDISQLLIPVGDGANIVECLPWSEQQSALMRNLCTPLSKWNPCTVLFDNLSGPNPLDLRVLQALMGHAPSGASWKEPKHYNQIIASGIFRPYQEDDVYSDQAPYNLTACNVPVHIYYGVNDWIVHPKNVRRIATMLPNVREAKPVGDKKFTHIDFMIGNRAKTLVYKKILFNLSNDTQERTKRFF
uniref:Lipase 3 n=1 Tax=Anopheles dirus TaxID=7168 RepID=A0A182N6M1_9DIPT